jgi:hypothetical protein
MPTPFPQLYPESQPNDWSIVRFTFEADAPLLDEAENDSDDSDELEETIEELLRKNDEEFKTKQCSRCTKYLPLSSFSKDCFTKSGYRSRCKKCIQETTDHDKRYERTKKSRKKNPEHFKELNKKWAATFTAKHPDKRAKATAKWKENNWAKQAVSRCKERANRKGIPFGMVASDLLDKTTCELPVFCPLFPHIRLDYHHGPDRRVWASVDKIVPELGYTKGNVWVMSMAANRWKDNGSNPAERERIVAIMQGQKRKKDSNPDQPSLFGDL